MKNKGLEIFGWCIMTSHVHLMMAAKGSKPENFMRDVKSHSSRLLSKAIMEHPAENRKEWMLEMMEAAGKSNSNNHDFQFCQQDNHPVLLDTNAEMQKKPDYIHQNPVEAGYVDEQEHYLYSGARDYCGEKGLIEISFME